MIKARILRLLLIPLVAVGIMAAMSSTAQATATVSSVAPAVTTPYTHDGSCIAFPAESHGTEWFTNFGTGSVAPQWFADSNPVGGAKWDIYMIYNGGNLKHWTFTSKATDLSMSHATPPPSGWRGAASLLHMLIVFDPYVGGTCSYNIQAAPAPN